MWLRLREEKQLSLHLHLLSTSSEASLSKCFPMKHPVLITALEVIGQLTKPLSLSEQQVFLSTCGSSAILKSLVYYSFFKTGFSLLFIWKNWYGFYTHKTTEASSASQAAEDSTKKCSWWDCIRGPSDSWPITQPSDCSSNTRLSRKSLPSPKATSHLWRR